MLFRGPPINLKWHGASTCANNIKVVRRSSSQADGNSVVDVGFIDDDSRKPTMCASLFPTNLTHQKYHLNIVSVCSFE